MKIRTALPFILPLLLISAVLAAQQISFDFDRAADFSKYRTFTWREGTNAPDTFLHKRIVTAVESELAARGLTRNDTKPDLYVLYHVVLDTRKTVTGWNGDGGFGPPPWAWGPGGGRVDLQLNELLLGTLVLDVADGTTRDLVWRGMAVGDIDVHAKPEKRDASITKAVVKLLKNYPPPRHRG